MVRRKIIWSHGALEDKLSILEFWYKKNGNSKYSRQLNEELAEITGLLKKFKKLGKQLQNNSIRYIMKGYLIVFYKVHEDFIEILKVKDSRQDLSNISL
jgi:plasmid stabilization system protein ParE